MLTVLPSWESEDAAYRARGLTIEAGPFEHIEGGNYSASELANFGGLSSISNTELHEDTEADDLWTAYHMWKRLEGIHPNTIWEERMNNLKDYFIDIYPDVLEGTGRETDNNYDHLYGWGLCDWYKTEGQSEADGGAAALTAINRIAAAMVSWNKGFGPTEPGGALLGNGNGSRRWARQLRFAVCAAEISPTSENVAWRDKVIDLVMQAADFDQTYKMYFYGSWPTDKNGFSYADGDRVTNTFHMGIWMDALWNTWRVLTSEGDGRADAVRQRLVDMASYYLQYGRGPDGRVPLLTGVNINTGVRISDDGYGRQAVYTMSPVNGLVFAYKLTGKEAFLEEAWALYLRTQEERHGAGKIGHYVDAYLASATAFRYLAQNKGELQYVYALFENGGSPTVLSERPNPPGDLTAD